MFKPVQVALGCLAAPLSQMANVMSVDPDLYTQLGLSLSGDDFTYMKIGEGSIVEVIRVMPPSGGVVPIIRGQDDTQPTAFALSTELSYCFCAAAVQHMIAEISPPVVDIQAQAGSGIVVDQLAVGQYEIGMEPVSVTSQNGSIVVTGQFPSIDLALDPSKTGCGCT